MIRTFEVSNVTSVSFIGFWTALFLVLAATGNCSPCGLERDYVGEYVSK